MFTNLAIENGGPTLYSSLSFYRIYQMSSVQNPGWLMIIGDYDYTTQYIGNYNNDIGEPLNQRV